MGFHFHDQVTKAYDFHLASTLSLFSYLTFKLRRSKLPWQRAPYPKELIEDMLWPKPAGNWGPQSSHVWGIEFCQKGQVNVEVGLSPVEASGDTGEPGLIPWLWESVRQRIHLSATQIPDPQKLSDNKCVLKLLNLGVISYAAIDN